MAKIDIDETIEEIVENLMQKLQILLGEIQRWGLADIALEFDHDIMKLITDLRGLGVSGQVLREKVSDRMILLWDSKVMTAIPKLYEDEIVETKNNDNRFENAKIIFGMLKTGAEFATGSTGIGMIGSIVWGIGTIYQLGGGNVVRGAGMALSAGCETFKAGTAVSAAAIQMAGGAGSIVSGIVSNGSSLASWALTSVCPTWYSSANK